MEHLVFLYRMSLALSLVCGLMGAIIWFTPLAMFFYMISGMWLLYATYLRHWMP